MSVCVHLVKTERAREREKKRGNIEGKLPKLSAQASRVNNVAKSKNEGV